ncbi:tetratricopeptide repeat protein [Ferrovum myxofaciens]
MNTAMIGRFCGAFLLGLLGFFGVTDLQAETLAEGLAQETQAWTQGSYYLPEPAREAYFARLQSQAHDLSRHYPHQADPLVWEGIITATHAKYQNLFSALGTARQARDVLLQAVAIDSSAMDGSGLITLGALYFRVPKFGSFGDDDKARQYLQQALKVDPDNIDANFFYGKFLLTQGDKPHALICLKKVIDTLPRPQSIEADRARQAEARDLLSQDF